jgi:hypothetical protein
VPGRIHQLVGHHRLDCRLRGNDAFTPEVEATHHSESHPWTGLPAVLLVGAPWMPLACMGLIALPSADVLSRSRLHRRGRLRCDGFVLLR